ncbi:MAG: potassium channel protein [Flavobacteriales bacterium]|nr:potassium channel protein [Flavobacteriales bacterium]
MKSNNILQKVKQKIGISLLILVVSLITGVIGYMTIEGYSVLEAVWFTVITFTSVGFGELRPLSNEGRIFTIFLMLFGTGFVLYAVSIIAAELLDQRFIIAINRNKMEKKISHLENHVIICGFGRNGRQSARKLNQYEQSFLVIDKRDFDVSDDTHKGLDSVIYLTGDATEESILEKAQIKKARGLIAALPSDADNLFIVMSAKQLNPKLKIISRASNSSTINKLKIAGANNVIMPDKIGGEHMASLIITPDLVEFMDNIFLEGTKSVNLLEINESNLSLDENNRTIKSLQIREKSGCSVIGYKDKDSKYTINPDDSQIIEKNSSIILLGRPQQIEKLKNSIYNEDSIL